MGRLEVWRLEQELDKDMVAWLSDRQCQEKTKQSSKTSKLRDNESDVHHFH